MHRAHEELCRMAKERLGADGIVLPLAGTWALRLDILITDFDIARIQGEVAIRP